MLQAHVPTTVVLSRRDKKEEARRAVQLALRVASHGTVRVEGEEHDLHAKILEIIRHYGFSAFPLDRRDVTLAIGWLHEYGKVRVSHHGYFMARTHVVTLL